MKTSIASRVQPVVSRVKREMKLKLILKKCGFLYSDSERVFSAVIRCVVDHFSCGFGSIARFFVIRFRDRDVVWVVVLEAGKEMVGWVKLQRNACDSSEAFAVAKPHKKLLEWSIWCSRKVRFLLKISTIVVSSSNVLFFNFQNLFSLNTWARIHEAFKPLFITRHHDRGRLEARFGIVIIFHSPRSDQAPHHKKPSPPSEK